MREFNGRRYSTVNFNLMYCTYSPYDLYLQQRVKTRLYENVRVIKQRAALHDSELQAFHSMVKKLRGKH